MNPYDKTYDLMRWQAYEEGADSRDDEVERKDAALQRTLMACTRGHAPVDVIDAVTRITEATLTPASSLKCEVCGAEPTSNAPIYAVGKRRFCDTHYPRGEEVKVLLTPAAEPEKSP